MNAMRLLAAALVVGLLGVGARADDKKDAKKPDAVKTDNAKLMVGKWEATKTDEGTLPKGSIVEFTKDGKIKISVKDQEMVLEGTYKVEGDTFTFTVKAPGGEEHSQKITIKKLTETECSTTDKDGKVVELTKKK